MEILSFFNNHITALDNGSQVGIHFELKDNEVRSFIGRYHLFWKSNLNSLVSDFSSAREKVALHSYWSDWQISLGIIADFDCAVTVLSNSLSTPLDIVLGTLSC